MKTIKDRIDDAYQGFKYRPLAEAFYDFYVFKIIEFVNKPQKRKFYLKYWNSLKKERF